MIGAFFFVLSRNYSYVRQHIIKAHIGVIMIDKAFLHDLKYIFTSYNIDLRPDLTHINTKDVKAIHSLDERVKEEMLLRVIELLRQVKKTGE